MSIFVQFDCCQTAGMPPEIIALIEKPYLLIVVILVGGFVGIAVERVSSKMRQQAWRERNRWRWERNRREGNFANGTWIPRPDSTVPK